MHGYRSGLTLLLALSCLLFRSLLLAESSITPGSPYQTFNHLDVSCLTTTLSPDLNNQKPSLILSQYLFHNEATEPGYTLHECSFKFYFPELRRAAATILSFGDNLSTSWQIVRQVSFTLMALLYNHNAVTQPSGVTDQSTPSHAYCYSGGSDSTCSNGHCPLVSLCQSHPCHQDDGDDNDPHPGHTFSRVGHCPKCGTEPCREAYPNNWVALLDSSYTENPFESLPDTEDQAIDVSTNFEFEPLLYEDGELIGAELIGEFSDLETDITYVSGTTESVYSSEENSNNGESSDSEDIQVDEDYSSPQKSQGSGRVFHRRPQLTLNNHSHRPLPLLTFLWQLVNSGQYPDTAEWYDKSSGVFRILDTTKFAELWSANKNKNRNISYENIARAMRYLRSRREGLAALPTENLHFRFDMNHWKVLNLKSQSRTASRPPKQP